MTGKISGSYGQSAIQQSMSGGAQAEEKKAGGKKFGNVLSKVASKTLDATASVAPFVPGGQLVGLAARGLSSLVKGRSGAEIATAPQDNLDKMWEMQEESQAFNMQYLQLQTQLQSDNRNFSTLSNLMKARHDTAKAAINNMHA